MDSEAYNESKKNPVVLVLDSRIQHLPLESMPCLRKQCVSRAPCLPFLLSSAMCLDSDVFGVDTSRTAYLLNPSQSLPKTEKVFSELFERFALRVAPFLCLCALSQSSWAGITGRVPEAKELETLLNSHDLFV